MKIKSAKLFLMIIVFTQCLIPNGVLAGPAPIITSFDIIAVCTGNDIDVLQCVSTSASPSSISVSREAGQRLYVVTRQAGYAAYHTVTLNGNAINSVGTIFLYDPYPIVSGFIYYWDCGEAQSGTFTAIATSINNYIDWPASIYISINPILSVTKQGTGTGTITPDSGTLSWNGNIGTSTYTANTLVSLLPTASAGSSFDGWNGACTNSSGTCEITMDTDKSVSATFSVIPNARIGDTYYGTLSSAYSAVSADGVIESKELTFAEDLTLDRDISFTLKGGYADDFSSITGFTTLNGVLTISSGSMIVDGLIIQ